MKCPECQSENRDGIKFCEQCGAKMEMECPNCNAKIPLGKKFCGDCGHGLTLPFESKTRTLSFDEKIARIQKYLPSGITEKVLSQRDRIEGEKRRITVLFADMENFTPLVEKLGPEEAYTIMDRVYEILIHKVHDYEGTVNEMTGDGVMALFGAPIALEDAPQRAVRSALAIHQEIARYNDRMKQEDVPQITMRIGIHTGPVVVGTLGNDLRVEFKAVGDTVNLASRIQNLAMPGAIYVSEDTFKLAEGLFRFESLGLKEIKGKEKPVKVYQVIASSSSRTRFDVSAERGLTTFVGRIRELENLLDGLDRAKAGKGQAFSLIGEAGVGKSRLLYEFHKTVANEDITFLEGKCLSYGRGTAYHPIVDILKSTFNIHGLDENAVIREKVTAGLNNLRIDPASALPFILELLSVKDSGIENVLMSPEGKKDRITKILKEISLKGSEMRPLVMAIEDLHWADESTENALKYVLEIIPAARILLIFTYRPEYVHAWGRKSYHNQLTLNRLSNRESLAMARSLLGTEHVDSDIEELILSRTEGIPFFIEEHIKALKDLKIIERQNGTYKLTKGIQTITIPSTIQDVIMARVDALPEGAREILRTGSVIEREFSHELLRKVTDVSEPELLSGLSLLKDSELIYERGIYPDSTYIFKHALTREVVYDTMLNAKKKILHNATGNAIEELYGKNLSEHYEVVAEHYFLSENYEKVVEYSKLASKKAEKGAALNDAIAHIKRRLTSLERLPQTEDIQQKIIDSRTTLGLYGIQMNYHDEAQEAIAPIIDLAVSLGYKRRLCQIYTIMGANYLFMDEDCFKAFEVLEEALKISAEVKNAVTAIFASYWFGVALSMNCEFEKSSQYIQKAHDINAAFDILWGIAAVKSDLSYFDYYLPGKIDLAYQTSGEAVRIAEESGDILAKAFSYPVHAVSCYGKGFLEDAERYSLRALEMTESIHHHLRNGCANLKLGHIYCEMGDFSQSKEHYEKSVRVFEKIKLWPSWASVGHIGFARAKVLNQEMDVDLEALCAHAGNIRTKSFQGVARRHVGEILLNMGDVRMPEAERWIQKAIETDQENGMNFYLGQDYALYADLFKRRGERLEERENRGKAFEIFKECGADEWAERMEKTLLEHP